MDPFELDQAAARRDVRMDGVMFFRSSADGAFARSLEPGKFSYCVAVKRGRLQLEIDFPAHSKYGLAAGDVVAVSGLAPHVFRGEEACEATASSIFEKQPMTAVLPAEIELVIGCVPSEALALGSLTVGPIVVRPGEHPDLSRRLWRAIDMLEDEYADASLADRSLVVRRLAEIMLVNMTRGLMADRRGDSDVPPRVAGRQILQAVNAFLDTPERPWSLGQLARAAGMSRSRFAEEFKAATGQTPGRIVSRLRLTQIAQRLSTEPLSIEAAAEEAGYSSSAAFVRAFQREFGETPARWRRARRGAETAPHRPAERPPVVRARKDIP